MSEIIKQKIPCYTMKLRIYPSKQQAEKIDKIFRALHVAYNITFHEVFMLNPAVCTPPKEDGAIWPDYRKMADKSWRKHLIELNPIVDEAPAGALMTNNALFLTDAKRAWETGMHNLPVNKANRKDFHFYSFEKPRTSFMVQMSAKNIVPSNENEKIAWLSLPKIEGKIKARGFNRKIWFGENGEHTFSDAVECGETAKNLSVRVSKDRCGDYYVSITLSEGKDKKREIFKEVKCISEKKPVGIDVGVKEIAALSDGDKVENPKFKKGKDKTLRRLNRKLSRQWGPSNIAYRDYNKAVREENKKVPDELKKPLAQPSQRYRDTQMRKARLERRIARKRETYYHQQTDKIARQSSMIAVETLKVKNMMRNHKLAYSLGDAAMSDFISKLKYKAERNSVRIVTIGTFEPSSQLCSICGYINPDIKDLSIREWTCPNCHNHHDRDINAAKNILAIALKGIEVEDKEIKPETAPKRKTAITRKPRDNLILDDIPDIVIRFSKELTKHNDPRYVIINKNTGAVVDDAQGSGYRSISNAKNCYKAKIKWSAKQIDK